MPGPPRGPVRAAVDRAVPQARDRRHACLADPDLLADHDTLSLPTALPSLIGATLFTFVIVWDDLLIALSLTSRNLPLPAEAAGFATMGMEMPWGEIDAAAVVLAVPPLLLVGLIMRDVNRVFAV